LSVVPAIEPTGNERLDLSGAALLAAGLIQTLGVVLFGRELGWPIWLAIPGIGGVVALIAFSKLESSLANRQAEPLIDPAWLRDRGFAIGLATTFAAYAGITSFLLVLTLYLQSGLGYSPLDAGLTVTALAVAFLVSSRLAARQDTAKGPILVCIGSSIMAAALVLTGATVSLFAEPPTPLIAILLALYGFGQGYVMAPLVNTVLARAHAVPPGAAAGVLVTTQQVAGAIGIALIGLLHFAFQSGGSEQRAFAISALALGGASIVTAISSAKLAGIAVQR
jgi:predicted MFS family arabinose efflux permease